MAVAAFSALVQTVVTLATGTSFANLSFFGFRSYAAVAAMTATYAVLGAVSRGLFDQGRLDTTNGINFNQRDPASTRKIVYGKCRVGGSIVFFNTSAEDNQYLHMVIAVAGHEIESFEEVYFGDEKVWENGSYLNDWDDHCLLSFHTGTSTQTADSTLVSAATGWSNSHRMLDTAYIYVRHKFDAEKYVGGVPNVSCVIKGKKVYDPGTDSTVWSDNPALILNDYLTDTKYGLGEASANIDSTALTNAEAICDEDMPISAAENQKKYTCNGVLDSGSSIKSNIENILTSMMGSLHWSNGKFYMLAHKYVAPVADQITDDMIVAPIQVLTKRSRSALYNTVKGNFVSEESNYIVSDYPSQSIASYVTNDGEEIALDLALPMTTENKRAQRIAYLTMKKSRLQMSIKLQLNLEGLKYKVGDNVEIVNDRFGWTSASPKVFEITTFQLTPDPERGLIVNIEAVENEDVDDWTGTSASTFNVPTAPDVYTGTTVVAPTNLNLYGFGQVAGKKLGSFIEALLVWDGVEEDDGADPYEPYLKHYLIRVTDNGNSGVRYEQQYTTTNTEQVVRIYRTSRGGSGPGSTTITVTAVNTNDFSSSDLTITNLTPDTVLAEPPIPENLTFESTTADPGSEHLTSLVVGRGIEIYDGLEILYIQVDADGDPVDSAEYIFESENFVPVVTSDLSLIGVNQTGNPELVSNGTYDDTSDWTLAGSAFSITGGKLVGTDIGVDSHAYQTIQSDFVGNHTLSFDIDSIDAPVGTTFAVRVFEGTTVVLNEQLTTTGTKTFTFDSQNRNLTIAFSGSGSDATIDNVSCKVTLPDAQTKYRLYLPAFVTSDVTFTHTESDKKGVPATGVTETYTGFTGDNLVDASRKYVDVSLVRSSGQVGFSQLKTTVTASWAETQAIGDVTKVATVDIILTARVY